MLGARPSRPAVQHQDGTEGATGGARSEDFEFLAKTLDDDDDNGELASDVSPASWAPKRLSRAQTIERLRGSAAERTLDITESALEQIKKHGECAAEQLAKRVRFLMNIRQTNTAQRDPDDPTANADPVSPEHAAILLGLMKKSWVSFDTHTYLGSSCSIIAGMIRHGQVAAGQEDALYVALRQLQPCWPVALVKYNNCLLSCSSSSVQDRNAYGAVSLESLQQMRAWSVDCVPERRMQHVVVDKYLRNELPPGTDFDSDGGVHLLLLMLDPGYRSTILFSDDNYCRGKSTPAQEKAYIAMVQVRTQRPTANGCAPM
jgi:hypothetical protein